VDRGGQFIQTLIASAVGASASLSVRKQAATALNLNVAQANTLASALADDAQDYYYSACLSVVDAIRGLDCGFYTWATVKLYYSVFYCLRARLAADRTGVFYVETTPYSITCTTGANGTKGSGTTHGFVLRLFSGQHPTHRFVTQTIDHVPSLNWLAAKREASNYRIPRFSEPVAPEHFKHVAAYGIRRLVTTYVADTTDVYTFDAEHAMLALPISALLETGTFAKGLGTVRIDEDELNLLTTECCDERGPLTQMTNVFRAFAS
jgi:hypothetical protein